MVTFVTWFNGLVWSPVLVVILLVAGLYFTFASRFVQVRRFREMCTLTFESKSTAAGISSFQALAVSLGDKVGTGNVAGVATAIAFGGPGAVFWMWVTGFLGMATSVIETSLAQVYKSEQDGEYRGGTPYYIEKALKAKWLAVLFAAMTMITGAFLLPTVQVNTIATSWASSYGIDVRVTAIALIVVLAIIIFGGVHRIARTAEYVVPFMAIGYILLTILILALNITRIPAMISLIFSSAFGVHATFGGIVGSALAWGVKRGAFSNGAGFGSETYAPAAAEVTHPAKQGLVQSLTTCIDTLVVCSMTAFMILITQSYNVSPDGTHSIVNHMGDVAPGMVYTEHAIDTVITGYGGKVLAVAILFFAFTSVMFYMYMADTGLAYIKRTLNSHRKIPDHLLKIGFLIFIYIGSVSKSSFAWSLADLGYGSMAWINVFIILILSRPALKVLKDYDTQMKQKINPVFDSLKVGIPGADFWEGYSEPPPSSHPSQQKKALQT